MSARQRKKLAAAHAVLSQAQDSGESDSDTSSEDQGPQRQRIFSFAGMTSSDESSSDSDSGNDSGAGSDSEGAGAAQSRKSKAAAAANKQAVAQRAQAEADKGAHERKREQDEALLLDVLIQEVASHKDSDDVCRARAAQALFSQDSLANLDIDTLINRRFAAAAKEIGGAGNDAGAGKAKAGGGARRRAVPAFGVKEHWGRPPAFAAGGLGMRRSEAAAGSSSNSNSSSKNRGLYSFQYSSEYAQHQRIYRAVADTGDVNRLMLFVVHCDSWNADCLLQLAGVFCKLSGGNERALDLVRRALHCFESSAMEGFFKCLKSGDVPLPLPLAKPSVSVSAPSEREDFRCLLDWRVAENTPFFVALFRYMQIAGMMGYNGLAADTGRALLALHPTEDPMAVLLGLDFYLLQAARAPAPGALAQCRQKMHAFFGLCGARAVVHEGQWRAQLAFAEAHESLQLVAEPGTGAGTDSSGLPWAPLSVAHLPSWWYSVALMEHMWEKQQQEKPHSGDGAAPATSFPGQGNTLGGCGSEAEAEAAEAANGELGPAPPLSELLLAEAVYTWPHVVPAVLHYMDGSSQPAVEDMDARVQASGLYAAGTGTGTATGSGKCDASVSMSTEADAVEADTEDGILTHLARVYTTRNVEVWAEESRQLRLQKALQRAVDFPRASAGEAKSGTGKAITLLEHANFVHYQYKYLQGHPSLRKYACASVDDFRDRFPHIPDDANPIDGQLQDPMLLEDEQLQRQRQHARRVQGVGLSQILGVDVEAAEEGTEEGAADFSRRFQRVLQAHAREQGHAGNVGTAESIIQALGGLDMQLLVQEHQQLWGDDNSDRGEAAEDDFIDRLVRWVLPALAGAHAPEGNGNSAEGPEQAGNANVGGALGAAARGEDGVVDRRHILDAVRPDDGYTLDMQAPLLQLFLQSIMPWFRWNH